MPKHEVAKKEVFSWKMASCKATQKAVYLVDKLLSFKNWLNKSKTLDIKISKFYSNWKKILTIDQLQAIEMPQIPYNNQSETSSQSLCNPWTFT